MAVDQCSAAFTKVFCISERIHEVRIRFAERPRARLNQSGWQQNDELPINLALNPLFI
jgi:hypothetical protein